MALAVHRYRYSGLIGIAVLVLSAALLSNTSPVCAQSGFLDGPPNLGAYSISTTGGITYFMHTVTLPVCFRNEFGAVSRSGSNISFTAWIAGPSPGWVCARCIDCYATETGATVLGSLPPGAYQLTIYTPPDGWWFPFQMAYLVIPFQVPSSDAQTVTTTRTQAGVRLDILGVPNATYVVESSSTLTNWTAIYTHTGAPFGLDVKTSSAWQEFYRVRVQ